MNRFVLALILAVFSGSAAAAWVRVGGNHDVLGSYADPASVRKQGGMVRMASLLDFKAPQTEQSAGAAPYLSQRDRREYDCKAARYRLLDSSLHAGHMSKGKQVRSGPIAGGWSPVVSGSLGEALWKFACRKKQG